MLLLHFHNLRSKYVLSKHRNQKELRMYTSASRQQDQPELQITIPTSIEEKRRLLQPLGEQGLASRQYQQLRPPISDEDRRRGVCFAFRAGRCYREACPYRHDEDASAPPSPPPQRICFAYQRGECSRLHCKFAHTLEADLPQHQQRRTPTATPRESGYVLEDATCRDFARGSCSRHNCRFQHTFDGSRGSSRPRSPFGGRSNSPPGRNETMGICWTFQASRMCQFGERCKYSHAQANDDGQHAPQRARSPLRPSDRLCFQYQKGLCEYGSRCKFSHDTTRSNVEPRRYF